MATGLKISTHLLASDEQILAAIDRLQGRQKRVHWTSTEWQNCSESLQPLFAEMARRQEAGLL